MTFHYTAIVFFCVFLLNKIEIKPRFATIIIMVTFLLTPILGKFINLFISKSIYSVYELSDVVNGINAASCFGVAVQLAILILGYFSQELDDENMKLYFNIQLLSTCITILGGIIPMVSRIKWYFAIPEIIFIPMVIENLNGLKKSIFSVTCIICFAVYFLIVIKVMGSYGVVPYHSIFD